MYVASKALQSVSAISTVIVRVPVFTAITSAGMWSNQPAAETFIFGNTRGILPFDTTDYKSVRLVVNKQGTAANTGATLEVKYKSGAYSTAVADYSQIGTSPVTVAIDAANTVLDSGWISLTTAAKGASRLIAVTGTGGDGILDPKFGAIAIDFK